MSTQSSQASTQSQGKHLSHQDLQTLINDTVVFLLSQDYNKHPIKRLDIVKNCMTNFGKAFKTVMDEVKIALKNVYGIDLIEIETNKQYMLINPSEMTKVVEHMNLSEDIEAHQILLLMVLSNIFMSGGVVKEEHLWNFLSDLEILGARKVHEYFGDVRKLVTVEFVRQMYVDYVRIPETDPPKYEFHWGKRAEQEVSTYEILKFSTKMYGFDSIKMWTAQYKEMEKAEAKKGITRSNDGSNDEDGDDEAISIDDSSD